MTVVSSGVPALPARAACHCVSLPAAPGWVLGAGPPGWLAKRWAGPSGVGGWCSESYLSAPVSQLVVLVVRSYTVVLPTVWAVKFSATQVAISLEVPLRPPPMPPPLLPMK